MSENLSTASFTALLAVIVYVLGKLTEIVFVIPIQKQKETLGKIVYALTYFGNRFPFTDKEGKIINLEELIDASDKVRNLGSDLRTTLYMIPYYRLFSVIGLVLPKENIKEASVNLIGWSNSFLDTDSRSRRLFRKKLIELLQIEDIS